MFGHGLVTLLDSPSECMRHLQCSGVARARTLTHSLDRSGSNTMPGDGYSCKPTGPARVGRVSELREREVALRERDDQSYAIVDSMPGMIAVFSAAGDLEFV